MLSQTLDFTEPTIVSNDDLSHRSFVAFQYKGEPQRLYHGKKLGLLINPNRANTVEEKLRLLNKLKYETHKALEANRYPLKEDKGIGGRSLGFGRNSTDERAIRLLFEAVKGKLRSDLSKTYKRDLKCVYREFRAFLYHPERDGNIMDITTARIEKFLSQFGSTGTYYMNKRRNLGVVMAAAGRTVNLEVKVVKETKKRKVKAKLHKSYSKEQLKPIFSYLKVHHPKLHLCCLLTYSAWLRPHEEVRLLTLKDFKKDWTEVHLSGDENKGSKVRVVYIPNYTREVLLPILSSIGRNDNIFSYCPEPLNESYFNTAWSRAYKKMFEQGLVYEDQTIYSFRHTAAVELYKKKKDVHLLQKLLGHSSITVTLTYLRSLGEVNSDDMRDAAPEL